MNKKIFSLIITILGVFFLTACGSTGEEQLDSSWLINSEDVETFRNEIGITQWKLSEEIPGTSRVCRMFEGVSWSVTPNTLMNCVNSVTPGSTFEEIIKSMYDVGVLYPADIELRPVHHYEHDFALYTHSADNGHAVYDAFSVNDDMLFRVSVTLGVPLGHTPETLFDIRGEEIETFLNSVLMVNLERRQQSSAN